MVDGPRLRIGELSRRVGVSPTLLRAWETRYGLVRPERSGGGLRLFSEQDERRVRLMLSNLAAGMPAAEAARIALLRQRSSGSRGAGRASAEMERALSEAVDALQEPAAQAALDRALQSSPLSQALSEVIIPFLRRLGERWQEGEIGVAHEHFASSLIGGRLRALARGWGDGVGPLAVLACPPGERHDLGLLCFGLALRERGWRITYLGADTPVPDLRAACEKVSPAIAVLCAVDPSRLRGCAAEIAALSADVRVAIAGAGATPTLASQLGAELLAGDPVSEAGALSP